MEDPLRILEAFRGALFFGVATSLLWAQAPPVAAVCAGRMLDPSGHVLNNQIILVVGERIAEVGPAERVHVPAGARVIDLSHATVLPGLIDAHTHIFLAGHNSLESIGPPPEDFVNTTREYRTLVALANTEKDLQAGFTSLRDLGNHGNMYADVDVRNAINRGLFEGPRLQVSTRAISTAFEALRGSPEVDLPLDYEPVASPWEARRAVQEQVRYGADCIKVRATGEYHFDSDGRLAVTPTLTRDEVEAIVDEAHKRGVKVSCHAFGGEGLANCVDASVDTVEHAVDLPDAVLAKMLAKGIFMVPTIYHYHLAEYTIRDRRESGGKNSLAQMRDESFRRAVQHGMKIGFGTGVGPFPHGSQTKEFEYMVKDGMTPLQAIQAATSVDARMIGWQDYIGSIEKGKFADIIAVLGDPFTDITELERVKFVMKGGEVVRNDYSK